MLQDKLSANQKLWLPHHHSLLVWAFYILKDGSLQGLDANKSQILRCILCHPTPATSASSKTTPVSKNTRKRVGMLKYTSEHGLTSMKKHVERDHQAEYVWNTNHAKAVEDAAHAKRQKGKKQKSLPPSSITEFFSATRPYKKCDVAQICFTKDLVLLIAKGCIALSMVENP